MATTEDDITSIGTYKICGAVSAAVPSVICTRPVNHDGEHNATPLTEQQSKDVSVFVGYTGSNTDMIIGLSWRRDHDDAMVAPENPTVFVEDDD